MTELDPVVVNQVVWPGRQPGSVKRAWIVLFHNPGYQSKEFRVTWCEGEPEITDPVKYVLDNLSQALRYAVPTSNISEGKETDTES